MPAAPSVNEASDVAAHVWRLAIEPWRTWWPLVRINMP